MTCFNDILIKESVLFIREKCPIPLTTISHTHGPQHTRLVKRWLTPPLHLAFSLVQAKATRFTHAGVRRGKHLLAFLSLIERQWNMPRPMHGSSEGYIGRGSDPGENEAENC